MNAPSRDDISLIEAIRGGDSAAWQALIDRYEGRLLAYAQRRLRDQNAAEDIVQETLIGFLVSLPNFDAKRKLESYLFSICGYKLTDHLRREGRRPAMSLTGRGRAASKSDAESLDVAGSERVASSIARSGERQSLEKAIIAAAIAEQIQRWESTDNVTKLKAIELLFVVGVSNQAVAERLSLSQQQVANYKSDFMSALKGAVVRQEIDADVFPELFA